MHKIRDSIIVTFSFFKNFYFYFIFFSFSSGWRSSWITADIKTLRVCAWKCKNTTTHPEIGFSWKWIDLSFFFFAAAFYWVRFTTQRRRRRKCPELHFLSEIFDFFFFMRWTIKIWPSISHGENQKKITKKRFIEPWRKKIWKSRRHQQNNLLFSEKIKRERKSGYFFFFFVVV